MGMVGIFWDVFDMCRILFFRVLARNLPHFGRIWAWQLCGMWASDCEEGPGDGHDWKKAESPTKDED